MASNYCGKSCDQCPKYLDAVCVGCQGGSYSRDCRIARCCREHGHAFCGTCVHASGCMTRKLRDQMPELMLDEQRRNAAEQSRRLANAEKLGTWLWPIFWLMIAQSVVSLLNLDLVTSIVPVFGKIAPIVMGVVAAAVGVCYLMLRDVDPRYRTVGAAQIVVGVYNLIGDRILGAPVVALVVMVAVLVMNVYSKYCECMAHGEVLHGIDDAFESKWVAQWNWYKIIFISFPVVLLLMIVPVINMLAMIALVTLCGLLVFVTVREYVYLYRMAELFRAYPGE